MDEPVHAIPTRYAGQNFRSRTEAKWAAFFDLAGWKWEYEPIDLDGYIPDFIVSFPHSKLLVEVKPSVEIAELHQFSGKIEMSGWNKQSLIVGSRLFELADFPACMSLGILSEHNPTRWVSGLATGCCGIGLSGNCQSHMCLKCGFHNNTPKSKMDRLLAIWREAGNVTQWRGEGLCEEVAPRRILAHEVSKQVPKSNSRRFNGNSKRNKGRRGSRNWNRAVWR